MFQIFSEINFIVIVTVIVITIITTSTELDVSARWSYPWVIFHITPVLGYIQVVSKGNAAPLGVIVLS